MVLVKSACRYDGTNPGPCVTRLETGIGRSGRWSGAEKEPGQTEYRQETGVCISNSLNIVKCFEDLQKGEHFFHKRHFGERFGCKVSLLSDSSFSAVRGDRMLQIRLSGHWVRTVYPYGMFVRRTTGQDGPEKTDWLSFLFRYRSFHNVRDIPVYRRQKRTVAGGCFL